MIICLPGIKVAQDLRPVLEAHPELSHVLDAMSEPDRWNDIYIYVYIYRSKQPSSPVCNSLSAHLKDHQLSGVMDGWQRKDAGQQVCAMTCIYICSKYLVLLGFGIISLYSLWIEGDVLPVGLPSRPYLACVCLGSSDVNTMFVEATECSSIVLWVHIKVWT